MLFITTLYFIHCWLHQMSWLWYSIILWFAWREKRILTTLFYYQKVCWVNSGSRRENYYFIVKKVELTLYIKSILSSFILMVDWWRNPLELSWISFGFSWMVNQSTPLNGFLLLMLHLWMGSSNVMVLTANGISLFLFYVVIINWKCGVLACISSIGGTLS